MRFVDILLNKRMYVINSKAIKEVEYIKLGLLKQASKGKNYYYHNIDNDLFEAIEYYIGSDITIEKVGDDNECICRIVALFPKEKWDYIRYFGLYGVKK